MFWGPGCSRNGSTGDCRGSRPVPRRRDAPSWGSSGTAHPCPSTAGARTIERLFPGVSDELARRGGVVGEWGRHSTMSFSGNRLRSVDSDLDLLGDGKPSPRCGEPGSWHPEALANRDPPGITGVVVCSRSTGRGRALRNFGLMH